MGIFVFVGKRLDKRGSSRRGGVSLDAEHPQNLLLEKTEDDINSADAAEQKLKDHAAGARVNVKGEKRKKMQDCYFSRIDMGSRADAHLSVVAQWHLRQGAKRPGAKRPGRNGVLTEREMARPERFELPAFWFVGILPPDIQE